MWGGLVGDGWMAWWFLIVCYTVQCIRAIVDEASGVIFREKTHNFQD